MFTEASSYFRITICHWNRWYIFENFMRTINRTCFNKVRRYNLFCQFRQVRRLTSGRPHAGLEPTPSRTAPAHPTLCGSRILLTRLKIKIIREQSHNNRSWPNLALIERCTFFLLLLLVAMWLTGTRTVSTLWHFDNPINFSSFPPSAQLYSDMNHGESDFVIDKKRALTL